MVDTGTGGVIQVDSTWVDPAAKKIVPRPVIDFTTVAEAKPRFVSAARQLLPDAARATAYRNRAASQGRNTRRTRTTSNQFRNN
jgi:hypothetical protein